MPTFERLPMTPFTPADAERAGISGRTLYRWRDTGKIEPISRGLYRRTDAPPADLDLSEIASRTAWATICLASALARHELIDTIPTRIDIAIPRGHRTPETDAPATWHHFDDRTFQIGRKFTAIEGCGQQIGLYTAERSIVDAFRLRGTEGYETATEALRTWLRRRDSHPASLMDIARQLPRAQAPIRQALEYLT